MRILAALLLVLGGAVTISNLSPERPEPQPTAARASAGSVCAIGTSCR